ncbi:phosphoribosylglycinamide formyltransferase [Rhodocaloribacter litoris]|uniref:phosphoribosylglycinamide formyltransferase n=1 Tax=Rhodocaloribacter litoris TaxID=2558931 RepID=UPI00141F8B5B|nr:phosphoribosylglycinamide formyltransferase [Rhodocaloribacter litoris]QXD15517.1 phosphoribosylglycinamide formyltransferase [Rhodocaloribacter litoris]
MSTSERIRLAVFASGGGSNFEAIAGAVARGALPLDLALCLSNRPDAGVLERAVHHGVPTAVLSPSDHPNPDTYVQALLDVLAAHRVNFIALAGYMRLVPAPVVQAFRHRILNIHPALLPAFGGKGMYGRRVHEAVLAYGVRWTGATVHLVDEQYDTGPIVLQEPVPVRQDDTPETLAARVLQVEHRLYPLALKLFAEGRVSVEGRRVLIRG